MADGRSAHRPQAATGNRRYKAGDVAVLLEVTTPATTSRPAGEARIIKGPAHDGPKGEVRFGLADEAFLTALTDRRRRLLEEFLDSRVAAAQADWDRVRAAVDKRKATIRARRTMPRRRTT